MCVWGGVVGIELRTSHARQALNYIPGPYIYLNRGREGKGGISGRRNDLLEEGSREKGHLGNYKWLF